MVKVTLAIFLFCAGVLNLARFRQDVLQASPDRAANTDRRFEALRRELREEAGVELTSPPVLHGIFFNSNASRRDHVVVYIVRAFSVVEPKQPSAEIAGAAFFPLAELPTDTAPSTRTRLHEVVTGQRAAATW